MSKNILFITETLFKERTGASTAIDGKQIFPMIKVAQDIHIQSALGSTLYKRLQQGIEDDDLNQAEKDLIDDYITDALVWFTMSMLPVVMGYQLFSKGFLQKTAEESTTPSRADLELLEDKYLSMGEYYKMRLIQYLQEHYTLFDEYLNIQAGMDVIAPDVQAYSSPIYLGDGKRRQFINSSSAIVSLNVCNYTSTGNETSFVIGELLNRQVYVASRSGLTKLITTTATNDTGFLQINNGTITLPTGDVTITGELFTFLYK